MHETDDDLIELLLIPKVGRAKARVLFSAGFKTYKDIAAADPDELAKLPGIGPELARSIVDYAFHSTLANAETPDKLETPNELLICPLCGSMVSGSTNVCSVCGITFSDEVEDLEPETPQDGRIQDADGHWYKDQDKLFICPECGSLVSDGAEKCPKCGVLFADEEEDVPAEPQPGGAEPGDADGYWYKKDSGLFMCPNCGAFIKSDATSCASCGVVFEAGEEEEPVTAEAQACPMCKAAIRPGAKVCADCGFDFSLEKEEDGHWYKDKAQLFLCPGCGAFIPGDATKCSHCGIALEGEEEEEVATHAPETGKCPMCGALLAAGSKTCAGCGFDFSAEEKDGFWYKESTALFICPGCGAFISEGANRCLNCGAEFNDEGEVVGTPSLPDRAMSEEQADDIIGMLVEEETAEPAAPATAEVQPMPPEPEAKGPVEAADDADSLYLCPVCGAFTQPNVLKCPSCNTVFDDVEEIELEPFDVKTQVERPEELARELAEEIREIEAELLGPPEEKKTDRRGGVSKDFLDRWKKLDSGATSKRAANDRAAMQPKSDANDADLELELEEMLVTDDGLQANETGASLIERARGLASEGKVEEAVACLDKAAEVDPDREIEYKRMMLELMGVGPGEGVADISDLIAIDDIGELSIDDSRTSEAALERLGEIDRELLAKPNNGTLWQEKGDILERLGRHEEAVECFDRSISLSYADLRKDSKEFAPGRARPQMGVGLTNGQGRINGRVNGLLTQRGMVNGASAGLVNGRTNGKVNGVKGGKGRINGLVNGLTNGRTNGKGRVNGLVNGLTNGRVNGRTNGFTNGKTNGLTNGMTVGLINGGLVNGLGLVNGEGMLDGSGAVLRLRHRRRDRIVWRYKLTAMVMFVTIVLMLSMLGNLAVREEGGAIHIDGGFSDWEDIPGYLNNIHEENIDPSLSIVETRMNQEGARLDVYVMLEGAAFEASAGPDAVDSIWVAIDIDPVMDTGYRMSGMGADLIAEIYGWNNAVMGSDLSRFNGLVSRDDWTGFTHIGSIDAAIDGERLEARINMPRDLASRAQGARVSVMTSDSEGNSDVTGFLMSAEPAGMSVMFTHAGDDIIAPNSNSVTLGEIRMESHSNGQAAFETLDFNITGSGNSIDLLNPVLRTAEGRDVEAHVSFPSGREVRFVFSEPVVPGLNSTVRLILEADIPLSAAGKTLGISLSNASGSAGAPMVLNRGSRLHNIGNPYVMAIDGAFGDWDATVLSADPEGDVVAAAPNSTFLNANVDLDSAGFLASSQDQGTLFFQISVRGTMMGGDSIPTVRRRPGPPNPNQFSDSDRDTVPDNLDVYYLDFNNDGIPDTEATTSGSMQDRDSDGQADYPAGDDWWLNATIPADFPAPYAGRFVSVYIGPIDIKYLEKMGDDRAYILIDADNDTLTGVNLRGGIGIDRVVVVSGKGNRIISSELYTQDAASETGWSTVCNVSAAVDWNRMEGAIPIYAILEGQEHNITAFVSLEDWRESRDSMDVPAGLDISAALASADDTRAAKPNLDVVKTVDLATAAPGDVLTYTITITNLRGATAYNVRLTETYPAGVTFVSASPVPTTGDNVWNIGTMAVGASVTITITVIIDSTGLVDGDVLTNSALLYYTDGAAWSKTKTDTAATTIVIPVPEMQYFILPLGGIMLISFVAFGKRRRADER